MNAVLDSYPMTINWQLLTGIIGVVIGALIAGLYNLRAKQNEFINDYYKTVIARRIAAYEQLEGLIAEFRTSVADGVDSRLYHLPFSSEDGWERVFGILHRAMSQALWLTDDVFAKLRDLNVLLFRFKKPENVTEFGKNNYAAIASLRANLEQLLAKDMLRLYDVKRFLKAKDKPDPGFRAIHLR